MMKLAVISRDGVVNHALVNGVNHRTQLELIDGSIAAMVKLAQAGYTLVLTTQQAGMSRGLLDLDELEAIHSHISSRVEEAGASIAAIFYCPHDEQDRCHCRPPETGLFDAIEMEFDCNASQVDFFFATDAEQGLASKIGCRAFFCDAQMTLLNTVEKLLATKT